MLQPNMNTPEIPAARILIVDDESAQMKALSMTLREEGYETSGFTDAAEALEALHEGQFELILTGPDDAADGRHRGAAGAPLQRTRT